MKNHHSPIIIKRLVSHNWGRLSSVWRPQLFKCTSGEKWIGEIL